MHKFLIDTFIVPEESKQPFLERAREVKRFLKTLPGFVEGHLCEKTEGDGRHDYVTTAVWESADALEHAKAAAAAEFKRRGFDPQNSRRKWKVETERAIFERSPY